jgi:transposase-like protein
MLDPNIMTDDERSLLLDALPTVKRENPRAEEIIRRLITAVDGLSAAPAHVSISEAARIFGVTTQTVRNWVDRGWILGAWKTPAGTRMIPRAALASAEAIARPRPTVPRMTPEEIQEVIEAPHRQR